jgi:hypothetical protein
VAAAVSVGAGVAATWPAASVPGVAFAQLGARLDARQLPGAALHPDYSLQTEQVGTRAGARQVSADAASARLARAAAARRAAARRAAARAAAARAAAAQATAAQGSSTQAASAPAAQPSGSAQQIAAGMLSSFGWPSSEFGCLDPLWGHESGWSVSASNPSSGAYGIPQAMPGSKMASAGPDWQTNPATQIRWGLGYIKSTYGSPCAAWSHEQSTGWY